MSKSGFSALQRAEIAEILPACMWRSRNSRVSVLFNEPKLLKSKLLMPVSAPSVSFSALQRAEIAEIVLRISLFALR